jgi:hypothetical protein
MAWIQVFTIIFSIIGLFLWMRSESAADRRETQAILREDRKDFITLIRSLEAENKDFHHRLLEIERNR